MLFANSDVKEAVWVNFDELDETVQGAIRGAAKKLSKRNQPVSSPLWPCPQTLLLLYDCASTPQVNSVRKIPPAIRADWRIPGQ
jgi:hypothetical protein